MKKFLTSLLLFIPFAALIYVVLLFAAGNNHIPQPFKPNLTYKLGSYGYTYTRMQEAKNTHDVDILFLGSSHAYRGFDTRIFEKNGLKVFNLGSSAQTPLQTSVLLDRYMQILNPKTIIYEVHPIALSGDGVESSLDIVANDRNDFASLEMVTAVNNLKTYNTFLYGFTRNILRLDAEFTEPPSREEDTYVKGGYVERKMAYFKTPEKLRSQKWNVNQKQIRIFGEIVERIHSHNINLVIVYAPITQNLYNSYSFHEEFDSTMKSYGTYYNFNELQDLDDSLHFYDSHHLNQEGVKIFNNKLLELF